MEDLTTTATAPEDELDLLACCLSGWDPADVDITVDDFDEPRHAATWQAVLDVAGSGKTVSPDSVRLALGPNGSKAAPWLFDVLQRPVLPANASAFAERIRTASRLRRLIDAGRGLLAESSRPGADPSAIADRYRAMLDAPDSSIRETLTLADVIPDVLEQVDHGYQSGLSTPWPDLDDRIHGLAPGTLSIVAARPGVGKSLMGQNLAWHWSETHGLPVYFASMEMRARDIGIRAIAQVARVTMDSLLSSHVSPHDREEISAQLPRLQSARIHYNENSTQTLDSIRNGARMIQRKHGLGLIVVDYLQIVTPRDHRQPREQQVAAVSRGLKMLAKDLHVPVVALSQIKRIEGGDKARKPGMSDLRESGAIENDADVVAILHIPDEAQKWNAELLVAKARAGRRGKVDLHMQTKWATVANAVQMGGAA